ncbi:hypothetical protein BKA70DRAFT_786210 [Coprinopsis sp. MPI-PUGE-AT-0042]|nr:hypothetical protein BKA70DRAFT_786210 [Coprinopsis sp. MPI-PUGE-AT-0042]
MWRSLFGCELGEVARGVLSWTICSVWTRSSVYSHFCPPLSAISREMACKPKTWSKPNIWSSIVSDHERSDAWQFGGEGHPYILFRARAQDARDGTQGLGTFNATEDLLACGR